MDPALVATISVVPYEGDGHRQQAPQFDPLSGEGARRRGGRFNPPESFPVLYLCSTRACAVAEFFRAGNRLAIGPEGLLPRHVFRYVLHLERIVDLTIEENLRRLGITELDLVAEDLSVTRGIGEAAHSLNIQAIRSPSATGQDHVLAILIENIGAGLVDPKLDEVWSSLSDVLGERG
jgi:RES domain-containing protein